MHICIYIRHVLRISSHDHSCGDKMTDWEVEALNEGETFFQLICPFSFFNFFFVFFDFHLKPSCIYTLSSYNLLGEGKELLSCEVPRFFISQHKK